MHILAVSLAEMITAIAGGVGAARMLRGLVTVAPPHEVTAVVNTGDDTTMHGLHVSPDLDTVMYGLAGLSDEARGWGLAQETWTVMESLERLGGEAWFRLGDRDLATHLFRTDRLAEGATLAEVTAGLCTALGVSTRLLPMSEQPVRTRFGLESGEEIAFQDYFVRRHHSVVVRSIVFEGAEDSKPAAGVLDAISGAERVVVCPSNPLISIGPVLAVPGIRDALAARRDSVVAVSPIIAGSALKGPADRLLAELGHESSVVGVAKLYSGFTGTLVIDEADARLARAVEAQGTRCVVAPTVMSSPAAASALASVVLAAA